jgi:hypothetical protein
MLKEELGRVEAILARSRNKHKELVVKKGLLHAELVRK